MKPAPAPVALATPVAVPGKETQDAAALVAQAVVTVEVILKASLDEVTTGTKPDANGSGVFIRPDGYLLTNAHVVEKAAKLRVRRYRSTSQKAEVIGVDPYTDLAVLRIDDRDVPFLEFRDSEAVPVGEWLMAVGNPYGLGPTVTLGVLSGRDRVLKGKRELVGMLQTDAAINPGNSGGPLTDLSGRIVGICTAIYPFAQGLGFAVDANTAQQISQQLIKDGKVVRGYLGLRSQALTPAMAEILEYEAQGGIAVTQVERNGPAARAKINKGDILLKFDGKDLESPESLRRLVHQTPPDSKVTIRIWRGGSEVETEVTLETPPES